MKLTLFLCILTLFISAKVICQDFDQQKMDSLFSLIEANEKGMGSISIFADGETAYENAFGYANVAKQLPATTQTKYRIGSITKTFTATIVMQLVQEGRLKLDTQLSEFFPEVKNSEKITIEHLLKHRSGIFNFTSTMAYLAYMQQPATKEEMVKKIVAHGSVFEPGTKAEYSNSNYVLLTLIAEKITGREYKDLLLQRICQPCGLNDTYYGMEIADERNEARSYTRGEQWELATETHMSIPMGAGAVVATPADLNRFLNCLFTGKLVSEATLATMMSLQDGFGIGLIQVPFYDKKAYGHTGGIDGFLSNAFYFPVEKVSIAYTSNGVVMVPNDILIGMLSIYFGKPYDLPTFAPPLQLSAEELEKYVGTYSSPTFPLKIMITKNENVLVAQATGQPSFPLEAYEPDKFKFDQAMLKMEFKPAENKMILRQGGGQFELTKE